MLAQRPDQIFNFTRRDFARLVVAAILLVVALSTILGVDVSLSGLGLQVGTIAFVIICSYTVLLSNKLLASTDNSTSDPID